MSDVRGYEVRRGMPASVTPRLHTRSPHPYARMTEVRFQGWSLRISALRPPQRYWCRIEGNVPRPRRVSNLRVADASRRWRGDAAQLAFASMSNVPLLFTVPPPPAFT